MIRSCAKKAVAEGLQRRFLTGRSSGIGVREDVGQAPLCSTSPRTEPDWAHRIWAKDGSFDILRAARIVMEAAVVSVRQMRRERCSALPLLLHADKARRLSLFNISWSDVAPPTSAAVASRPTEFTRAKTNSVRAQAADSTSQDALVCIRIFIEQALISRCGCMQHRQRVRTPAENSCTNNDMRMLISRWTA